MITIFYSSFNSPLGELNISWTEEPQKKIISLQLPYKKYNPSEDRSIRMFLNKKLNIKNLCLVDFVYQEENEKIPNFVNLLITEIKKYFSEGKNIEYPIIFLCLDHYSVFSQNVLTALMQIPFGELISYKKLSEKAGTPNASRAVGNVMNKNPYPLIIPCHRVIKEDWTIGGFAPGTEMKKVLLIHENTLNKIK